MNLRAILTISVTSGLFGVWIVYALVMNMLIGVQTLETAKPVELPPPEPPADSQRMVEEYLASPDSEIWELTARKRVCSGDSYFYCNEWEHRPYRRNEPDNAVEFNPFAMIVRRDGDRPFTMQAETARIRFANEFSFSNPDPGRPVDGALQGNVRITGPDGLEIHGRNFIFSEDAQKIYSDEVVEFRYRNHHGTAGKIRLDLTIDPKKIANGKFAVAGVDVIRLTGPVELHLDPQQADRAEDMTVNCRGVLVYDTALNIATLRDDVSVLMPTETSTSGRQQYDSLKCDTLKLQFAAAENGPSASPPESGENLTLTQLEATAVSGRQPVIFRSQQNDLEARMTHFHYNRISRVATLTDLNNQVSVAHKKARIFSPRIVLAHDAEGEMQTVQCDRAGRMQYFDEQSGELSLEARWQQQLRIRPEDQSGLYLIELDRQARVQRPQENMELSADHMKLWVSGGQSDSSLSDSSTPGGQLEREGQPENLLALGNVRMNHQMIRGHTDRLEVWFQESSSVPQPLPHEQAGTRGSAKPLGRPGSPERSHAGLVKVVHKQDAPQATSLFDSFTESDGRDQPFDVWADLIQVLVYRSDNPDDSYVGGVVTTGDVVITQPKSDGSQPLRMEGNRIEVRNRDQTNQNQVVHVFGSPAKISDAEASLAGNLLSLDRSSNRAWVTGPGVLMRPVDSGLDGEEFAQPELLKVWWKEKMEFDGRTAHFFDRVRTELGTSSVLCQEMKVTLNQRVDFQEDPETARSGDAGEKIDIQRLECLYGVQVDSEEYENGELTEIRQGEFGELVFERARDQSTIVGPGRIYVWQKDQGSDVSLSSGNEAIANQPLRTGRDEWVFLKIDFNGNIDGHLDRQTTEFSDGVEIVYGPVSQTGQKLDPHHLPDRGGWIRSERLEVSRHEETDTETAWLELKASGNVKLEGQDRERFRARADSVTFDQSKQLYRLRTLGDHYTTIWRQPRPGDPFSRAKAKVMQFIPSKHDLKLDGTTSLEGIE